MVSRRKRWSSEGRLSRRKEEEALELAQGGRRLKLQRQRRLRRPKLPEKRRRGLQLPETVCLRERLADRRVSCHREPVRRPAI